jgi:hypothetical protein
LSYPGFNREQNSNLPLPAGRPATQEVFLFYDSFLDFLKRVTINKRFAPAHKYLRKRLDSHQQKPLKYFLFTTPFLKISGVKGETGNGPLSG